MRARGGRRGQRETVWAPLADTMTILACVFLLMFLVSEITRRVAEAKLEQLANTRCVVDPILEKEAKDGRALKQAESKLEGVREQLREIALRIDGAELAEVGTVRLPEQLLFSLNHSALTDHAREIIRQKVAPIVATALKTEGIRIMISGHADASTDPNHPMLNWDISTRRAVAVLEAVLDARPEIDRQRVMAVGRGDTMPVQESSMRRREGVIDPRDRRVEIGVLPEMETLFAPTLRGQTK